MSGRMLVSILLGMSMILGGLTYYYQNYAYYSPVVLETPAQPVAPQVAIIEPNIATDSNIEVSSTDDGAQAAAPTGLVSPADSGQPVVDTTSLAKPKTGEGVAGSETPTEPANPPTPTAMDDGTTPSDPGGATAGPLADAEDNIRVAALSGTTSIRLTRVWDNQPEVILAKDFQGIDAPTSPLKFKGCFTAVNSIAMMTEAYVVYDDPTPIKAPVWFQCYSHQALTDDLETGEAVAFLGESNVYFGIDRVVAVYGDGRAFAWHQINKCGQAAYAGNDLPAGCPPKPEQ